MRTQDESGTTIVHYLAELDGYGLLNNILSLLPELHLSQVVCLQDKQGRTPLHCAANSWDPKNHESIRSMLTLLPEPHRSQVVDIRDTEGKTVLEYLDEETRNSVIQLLQPPKQDSSVQKRTHDSLARETEQEQVDIQESEAKRQRSDGAGYC